ncbi:MAG: P-loop ATPase, Sll1717 family, partial [Acidimicrobiia bacterium]
MEKLDVLRHLSFGQRVAEEEGDTLSAYFVETDHWQRLYSDQVDVVYGPKGAGKSALYSLLIARTNELFDRHIILAPAENPRGAPAFKDLVTDPPASEREFIALWKLYFACLMSGEFDDLGIGGDAASRIQTSLEREGLLRGPRSLQGLLRAVVD